uniref:Uncharacterized protein LOC114349502 n=1 Tax=Diabrotica virgifera virgifera TaxID=50390 RepID=A0A6P7HAI7_DIAVI
MALRTRDRDNRIIGSDKQFSDTMLPTIIDVMRHYNYVWHDLQLKENGKNPDFSRAAEETLDKVQLIWRKASIPMISYKTMRYILKRSLDEMKALNKSFERDQHKQTFSSHLSKFLEKSGKLFDVCTCKCSDLNSCSCVREKKVPVMEREFLIDQRTVRQMMIGNIDLKSTAQNKKRIIRKEKETMKRQEKEEKEKKEVDDNLDFPHDTDETVLPQIPSQNNTTETEQTRINIGTFARTCNKYGIPDRPAAALASALLKDMGIKETSQSSPVFDKNKVRRERIKIRKEILSKDLDETNLLQALYFDGRIDKTYFIETSEDGKKTSSCP